MTQAPRVMDLKLHLLDRQVVDADGRPLAKVDDLELTPSDDGDLLVTAILCGPLALAPRLGGRLGLWVAAAARRLSPDARPQPQRIDMSLVREIGSAVTLNAGHAQLDIAPLERWVEQHLVGRIPGAGHESQ
jgi:sporulation protein YlmC with PRC-barrel domain